MNEAQKAAIARELGTFQVLLAEVDACASCVQSELVLIPPPRPGAPIPTPIPTPVFGKVAKAIRTQNQMLYRLTKVLESVLRD
jgi:hypothetical protein